MDLMARYKDKHFDLAIVDPPYGIGEDGAKNHSRGNKAIAKKHIIKNWDKNRPSKEYFNELIRVSKNQIIWGGNYFADLLTPTMGWIFWDKHMSGDFSAGELAYTSFNKALEKFDFAWNGMLQGDMKNKETRIHPTQKPVALYKWLLKNYAKEGDLILDTHVGSASSLIACEEMGFDYVGCELDKDYYDMACKRIETYRQQLRMF